MKNSRKGKLFLIPSPISEGSLEKFLTSEMVSIIKSLSFFLVENIRTTRRFISSLNLDIKIDDLQFDILDKNTPAEEINRLCAPLFEGNDMGVLSEAGCPGIADPGNLAIDLAHRHEIEVIPLVGPSSIFMALMDWSVSKCVITYLDIFSTTTVLTASF